MIGHYLAMAFAKIRKTPFTTLANIVTLAMGLACFMAAWGIATWWQSGDTYHRNADRLVLVGSTFTPASGSSTPLNMRAPATVLNFLEQDFPELEKLVRVFSDDDISVASGASKQLFSVAGADPDFLEAFDFTYLAGGKDALAKPGSVVVTEEAANRLFGGQPALGRTVRLGDNRDATITGVVKAVRQPSFMGMGPDFELRFDVLESWASSPGGIDRDTRPFWAGNNTYGIGLLKPGASLAAVNARLPAFVEKTMPADTKKLVTLKLTIFPISEISTRRLDASLFFQSRTGLTTVSVLIGLGILTLIVACINYASLATAQAASRAKEFGMRRVMGAAGGSVMLQAWLEALMLTGAALVLAIAILALVAPIVRNTMSVDVLYFLTLGPSSIQVVGGIVLAVTLVAGAYPALILSRIRPADALRSGKSRSGPGFMARILVGIQFASASFLLILVTVAQQQRIYLEEAAIKPHADPIVVLNDIKPMGIPFATLEAELKAIPGVKSVSMSDRMPWTTRASVMGFAKSPTPASPPPQGYLKQVGYDYFETLDMKVLAGRDFQRDRETKPTLIMLNNGPDPIPLVIDEVYLRAMGYGAPADAVGQIVWLPEDIMRTFNLPPQAARIIGVTQADRMRMGSAIMSGHMYIFAAGSPRAGNHFPIVKVSAQSFPQTMDAIRAAWQRLSPNVALNTRYLDALFEQTYRQYAQIGQIFIGLAMAAFVIASVGLLGIAVHVAVKRRHEVAVRKTLGSSAVRVTGLLLTDFSKPVIVGNVIAWPLAWVAANAYLSAFANRIDLTATPFLASMGITLVLAWAAVIGVVLKAATLRPAEVLRCA